MVDLRVSSLLDLRLIRNEPEAVRATLARRSPELAGEIDEILALDERWREANTRAERLRAMQRAHSESAAAGRRAGEDVSEELQLLKEMSAEVKLLSEQAAAMRETLDGLLARLPNLPLPSAADGPEDELVREVGQPRALGFPPRDHLELAGAMIDMDAGARLSGSRFAYLKGDLVLLELALVAWALGKLRGHGFEPVVPPVLVRERALFGTGFLPDTEQQIYIVPDGRPLPRRDLRGRPRLAAR